MAKVARGLFLLLLFAVGAVALSASGLGHVQAAVQSHPHHHTQSIERQLSGPNDGGGDNKMCPSQCG